jgi:hypothetical protein
MWARIWETMKELAASKKFQLTVLAAITWLVGRIGFDVDQETLGVAVGIIWSLVFGIAFGQDLGKEKAKIQAASLGSLSANKAKHEAAQPSNQDKAG